MTEPDRIGRVCMRVTDVAVPHPGSVQRECCGCGQAVWYLPSQPVPPGLPEFLFCVHCAQDDPEISAEMAKTENWLDP